MSSTHSRHGHGHVHHGGDHDDREDHEDRDGHDHTAHDHGHHGHHHLPAGGAGRAFAIGVTLNLGFVIVEAAFGIWSNSLALLADASHNFGDVISLLLAWGAAVLATRIPTAKFTYGLRGTTILAALTNAMLLLVAIGGIVWASIDRLREPAPINDAVVIWVAAVGVVINTVTALMFMRDSEHDLNRRGAFLHMAGDAAVSVGVVIAGFVIGATGWLWLDPAISIVIALVIFASTWNLLKESVRLAVQAVPENVDPLAVRSYLSGQPGVSETHDLHIWAMSTTENAMTAHLVMPSGHPGDDFLARITEEIESRFRIGHVTLQVETGQGSGPCRFAPEHVV